MDALRRLFGCKSNRINAAAPERNMEEGEGPGDQAPKKDPSAVQPSPFNHPLEMGRLAATRYGPPIPSGRSNRQAVYIQHPSIPEAVVQPVQQLQLEISDPVQPAQQPPPLSVQLDGIREYAAHLRATTYAP